MLSVQFFIEWIMSNIFLLIIIPKYPHLCYEYSTNMSTAFIDTVSLLYTTNSSNQNNDVKIFYDKLQYTIPENQPIHYRIGKIDEDLLKTLIQFNKTNLHYKLHELSDYIEVNETTSLLVTKTLIDLESICSRHCHEVTYQAELHHYVTVWLHNQLIGIVYIQLIIIDIDDNKPIFPLTITRPYKLQLKEVIYHVGKSIELPTAIDNDIQPNHKQIVYRLDALPNHQSIVFNTFHLVIRNNSRLLLILQNDFDYELIQQYHFYVICSSPSTTTNNKQNQSIEDYLEIIIDVLNINDMEPIFSQSIYEIQILENTAINSVIYELIAIDKDVNSTLIYSMENDVNVNVKEKFFIKSTGEVIIKNALDYEECHVYSLIVHASDGEFYASTKLYIKLIDVNDEQPEFLLNPYELTIKENQPAKTLIGQLLIIDRDSPEVNGQVHCEEPSNLRQNQPILFVQESLYLHDKTSYQDVYNTSSSSMFSTISSNTETHVYQRYTLYSQKKFDREHTTEKYQTILYCWDGVSSSRTLSQVYSPETLHTDQREPIVVATTTFPSSSLTATMTIVLQILDENDNEPTFDKQLYITTTKENSPIGTKIIKMNATDKDVGVNGEIYYGLEMNELIMPYFQIDSTTGWIINSAVIDREAQATFKLTVLAIDGGYQAPSSESLQHSSVHHTATTQLLIHILDENDNPPEFHGPRQFAIEENQPVNTWIGDLQAFDRDEGINSEVTFKLYSDQLSINNIDYESKPNISQISRDYNLPIHLLNNGSLFTTRSLDRENQSHYCFEVIATDHGHQKVYSTEETICIRVLDVNDNKPYFNEIKGEVYAMNITSLNESVTTVNSMMESSKNSSSISLVYVSVYEEPGYCVLIAKAIDLDEGINSQLKYNILHQYSSINVTSMKHQTIIDAFQMDSLSGQVILTRNLHQYELGTYEMIITVEDNGKPVQRSEKTIQLVIENTPARGNWLLHEILQGNNTSMHNIKHTISEVHRILLVIFILGMSTFLAVLFICTILCMIRPCRRVNLTYSNDKNSYRKEFNETIVNHDNAKISLYKNEIVYNACEFSMHNQRKSSALIPPPQHDHLSGYTSGGNVDILSDNIPLHTTYQGLVISNNYSNTIAMDNCIIPHYKFIGPNIYANNNISTCRNNINEAITFTNPVACTMNMHTNEHELNVIHGTRPMSIERVLSPLNIVNNTIQPAEWNSFIVQLPQNDNQQISLNNPMYNQHIQCSLHSLQQLNCYHSSYPSTNLSTSFIQLTSSSNSMSKSNHYTNTLPISSNTYLQFPKSISLTPVSLLNTSALLDVNTINQCIHQSFNECTNDCNVNDVILPITGEEQRSDSGRGASDEENSNRIHLNPMKTPISL
ncbi:Protocadherin-like wing polarity protein stan [Schistosoma japonicum]|nr:Protocadherin-like wing polarity protein stan [Schistosoma japonicum]